MTTLSSIGSQTLTQIDDNAILIKDPRLAMVADAEDSDYAMSLEFDGEESIDLFLDRKSVLLNRQYVTAYPGPGEFVATNIDELCEGLVYEGPTWNKPVLALVKAARPERGRFVPAMTIFYTLEMTEAQLDYHYPEGLTRSDCVPDPVRTTPGDWSIEIMWDYKGEPITHGDSDGIERLAEDLLAITSRLIGTGFTTDVGTDDYLFRSGVAANCALHLVCDVLEIAGNIDLLGAYALGRQYERPSTRPSFPSTHPVVAHKADASFSEIQRRIYESACFYGTLMSTFPKDIVDLRAADCTNAVIALLCDRLDDLIQAPAWMEEARQAAKTAALTRKRNDKAELDDSFDDEDFEEPEDSNED